MILTVELKDELAAKVERLARREDKSVSEFISELIDRQEESKESIVDEIRRLTAGFSLPADFDEKADYHEYIARKHA